MTNRSKGCWPRFSLKSLLLATTLFAVWLGVMVDRARHQREAVAWVLQQGGWVTYDYQQRDDGSYQHHADRPGPQWLRQKLGIDFFSNVIGVTLDRQDVADLDVSPLKQLPHLKSVGLIGVEVTDFSPLTTLKQLELIRLDYTHISPDELDKLKAALPECRIYSGTTAL